MSKESEIMMLSWSIPNLHSAHVILLLTNVNSLFWKLLTRSYFHLDKIIQVREIFSISDPTHTTFSQLSLIFQQNQNAWLHIVLTTCIYYFLWNFIYSLADTNQFPHFDIIILHFIDESKIVYILHGLTHIGHVRSWNVEEAYLFLIHCTLCQTYTYYQNILQSS